MQAPGGSLLEMAFSAVERSAVLLLPLHGNRSFEKMRMFRDITEPYTSSISDQ